jgi:sortase A
MRRTFRIGGTVMIVAGMLAIGWALLVWQWQDPFTNIYTRWQQHKLADRYAKVVKAYQPPTPVAKQRPATAPRARKQPASPTSTSWIAAARRDVALEAKQYRLHLHEGDPVGRLKVPRLGLSVIVVNGTSHDSLTEGPGRYLGSYMPGEHELVYIAGHRTTYAAPFAHIDALRPGDRATLELPYATFVYEIRWHAIVRADDIARLRSHHREVLALQACHPRFFATHRYIAYAILVRVEPRNGRAYTLIHSRLAATTSA